MAGVAGLSNSRLQAFPGFLKVPMSSFFFVSRLKMG